MAKHDSKTINTEKRRRLISIGPGLIAALILSIVVGCKYAQVQAQVRERKQVPPIIERQVISSNYEEKAGPTPEVRFIISHKGKLGLNSSEIIKLKKLQSDWDRFYQPKIAEANAAADRTNRYLSDAKSNRRTPVAQIQDEAGPMIELSREISTARRDCWNRAIKILTPAQRTVLQKEREADWAAKLKAIADR